MANKPRKRIIPRNKNFTLTGDRLEPHFRRLFRFISMDDSLRVLRKVDLTLELFLALWDAERYLIKQQRIEDVVASGQECDTDQINRELDYPEPLLLTAFTLLKERQGDEQTILNETLLREVHQAIQDAFRTMYPQAPTEFIPREAYEYYHRGNNRIFECRHEEALADFLLANAMEPNNHIYEFAIGQYCFRYGQNGMTALIWIDRAISHLDADAMVQRVFYRQLKSDICISLGEYGRALESLHRSTETLKSLIEDLEWRNGTASLGEGREVYAEGVRCSLYEAIENAETLLLLLDSQMVSQVQPILTVLRKLRKHL